MKYVKNNILHYLMRNQVYIHFRPSDWTTEKRIQWDNNIIVPDAIYRYNNQYYVLEVDNTQLMIENKKKITIYREFKQHGNYSVFPIILFVTTTEYRQKQLRSLLDGLKSEVLLYKDLI